MTATATKPAMTERELQDLVVGTQAHPGLARVYRWHIAHFRPAQDKHGLWKTPVAANGEGFPDLLMLRGGRMLVVELKSAKGRLTEEQEVWLAKFRETLFAEVHVWRPSDWESGEIMRALE